MRVGTKSLLFGTHQFILHPLWVAYAWCKLYGFPWDLRLWIAFIVHDWGYWGMPDMDGEEGGKNHPLVGAEIMGYLFGVDWYFFTLYHSRYWARLDNQPYSRLCFADKAVVYLTPWWFYYPFAWLTGELKEYIEVAKKSGKFECNTPKEWFVNVGKYIKKFVIENYKK